METMKKNNAGETGDVRDGAQPEGLPRRGDGGGMERGGSADRRPEGYRSGGDYDPKCWLVTIEGESTPYECLGRTIMHEGPAEQESYDYRKRQTGSEPNREEAYGLVRAEPHHETRAYGKGAEGDRGADAARAVTPITVWPPFSECLIDPRWKGLDRFTVRIEGEGIGPEFETWPEEPEDAEG